MDPDAEPDFPARVNVTIEKPGSGALLIQTVVQNGYFQIEDLSYFAKPDLAHAQTAEKDWARQALYSGPPFGNLDETLQGLLDRYLEERGIDSELATMIPDYIQVKEQKEYVTWLESKFCIFIFAFMSNSWLQISKTLFLHKCCVRPTPRSLGCRRLESSFACLIVKPFLRKYAPREYPSNSYGVLRSNNSTNNNQGVYQYRNSHLYLSNSTLCLVFAR